MVRMTLEGTSLLKLQETCFTDLNGATNEQIQIPYILQFQSLLTLELAKKGWHKIGQRYYRTILSILVFLHSLFLDFPLSLCIELRWTKFQNLESR